MILIFYVYYSVVAIVRTTWLCLYVLYLLMLHGLSSFLYVFEVVFDEESISDVCFNLFDCLDCQLSIHCFMLVDLLVKVKPLGGALDAVAAAAVGQSHCSELPCC